MADPLLGGQSELAKEEIAYLKENLKDVNIINNHCTGFFTGDSKAFEDFLDDLQLLTSTTYIHSETKSKEKGHKRLSQTGMSIKVFEVIFSILKTMYYQA